MQILSVSSPKPVTIEWQHGIIEFLDLAGISIPARHYHFFGPKSDWRGQADYSAHYNIGRAVFSAHSVIGQNDGYQPDMHAPSITLSNLQRLVREFKVKVVEHDGAGCAPTIRNRHGAIAQIEQTADLELVLGETGFTGAPQVPAVDLQPIYHHVTETTSSQVVEVCFSREKDPNINRSIARAQLLAESELRAATFYEMIAYGAKYSDSLTGKTLAPWVGFSRFSRAVRPRGVPLLKITPQSSVLEWHEARGHMYDSGGANCVFLAIPT